jgi:hypothetical protein
MPRNICGREPAVIVGFLEAALATLLSFGFVDLTKEQLGAITATVSALLGLYVAAATKDTLLGVFLALGKALLSLGVAFGLSLTSEQTGVLIALGTAMVGLFQRTQTTPLANLTLTGGWTADGRNALSAQTRLAA